jgi:hypothetical protein
MTQPLSVINDDQLFLKEEVVLADQCFLLENSKFIRKPELFKFCEFKSELNEVVVCKTKLQRLGYFLLGLAFGIPYMMVAFAYNLQDDRRVSMMLGAAFQVLAIVFFGVPLIV